MNKAAYLQGYMEKEAGTGTEYRILKRYFNKFMKSLGSKAEAGATFNHSFPGRQTPLRVFVNKLDRNSKENKNTLAALMPALEGATARKSAVVVHPEHIFAAQKPGGGMVPVARDVEGFPAVIAHELGHDVADGLEKDIADKLLKEFKNEKSGAYKSAVRYTADRRAHVKNRHDNAVHARTHDPVHYNNQYKENMDEKLKAYMKMVGDDKSAERFTGNEKARRYLTDEYRTTVFNSTKEYDSPTANEALADALSYGFVKYMRKEHPGVYERLERNLNKITHKRVYLNQRKFMDSAAKDYKIPEATDKQLADYLRSGENTDPRDALLEMLDGMTLPPEEAAKYKHIAGDTADYLLFRRLGVPGGDESISYLAGNGVSPYETRLFSEKGIKDPRQVVDYVSRGLDAEQVEGMRKMFGVTDPQDVERLVKAGVTDPYLIADALRSAGLGPNDLRMLAASQRMSVPDVLIAIIQQASGA